jgi:hypothetical protein
VADRVCIRGCTHRDGRHLAACVDYGIPLDEDGYPVREASCRGCVPVDARDGAMICDRCYRGIRRHLEDAADVVAHLRSVADPTKAAVYDRVNVSASRPDIPAPVAAVLIDSGDSIVRLLFAASHWVEHGVMPAGVHRGLPPGCPADVAFDTVNGFAMLLLADLDQLANDHHVVEVAEVLLTRHDGDPAGWPWWSVADALARWPLDDRERWATTECPSCTCKTVRVTPPRRAGMSTRFRCTTCTFDKTDRDDDGLWAEAFAEPVPVLNERSEG